MRCVICSHIAFNCKLPSILRQFVLVIASHFTVHVGIEENHKCEKKERELTCENIVWSWIVKGCFVSKEVFMEVFQIQEAITLLGAFLLFCLVFVKAKKLVWGNSETKFFKKLIHFCIHTNWTLKLVFFLFFVKIVQCNSWPMKETTILVINRNVFASTLLSKMLQFDLNQDYSSVRCIAISTLRRE